MARWLADRQTRPISSGEFKMKIAPLLLSTILLAGIADIRAVESAVSRPNILVLLSDDQGYADYGFVSQKPDVKTPHLDGLAREGMFFPNALSVNPVCSPSRAGIMTGRYPQRGGIYWFTGDKSRPGIPDGVTTIAEYLREAGYATGYIGKLHYDGGEPTPGLRTFPTAHGFEHFFGATTGGTIHYLLHSDKAAREKGAAYAKKNFIAPLWRNEKPQRELDGFTTDLFAEDAVNFIKTNAGKRPFYLHVAWNAVHSFVKQLPPSEAKRRGFELDEEGNAVAPLRQLYLAQLELMDAGVGRILDALRESGQLDNTLILFTSDNGGSSGADNKPLTGGKYHLYEGGVRTPIIARLPGRFAPGARSDAWVSHMDFLPTILEAAGVSPKPDTLEGTSLFGSAKQTTNSAARTLFHDTGFQWSVHQGDWKLLVTSDEAAAVELEKKYKLKLAHGVNLFNLREDPAEQRNLAADHPGIVGELTRLHTAWRKDCRPPAQAKTSSAEN